MAELTISHKEKYPSDPKILSHFLDEMLDLKILGGDLRYAVDVELPDVQVPKLIETLGDAYIVESSQRLNYIAPRVRSQTLEHG